MTHRTRVCALLIAALATLLVLPGTAVAQEPLLDTISVSATGKVDVEPDLGTVVFGINSRALTAQVAADRLATRTRRVIRALKEAGFTTDEISTEGINLYRRCFRDCRDPHPQDDVVVKPVFGFVGSVGVRVETSRLKQVGRIIDVGIDAGAKNIQSVFFSVEDKTAAVQEALAEAMDIAIAKADVLAEAAGRTRGPALIIVEGRTTQPRNFYYAQALPFADSAGATASFPIELPTLSASGHIEVTFELQ
ncbi:MAG: uncharacterized protein QOH26_265 [Actinomycetota bacterium]|jgi:uncharacterized protein YggE|nr:uncharacterized protein [Actinomycetota bacterium]